jgi:hypothetical protein
VSAPAQGPPRAPSLRRTLCDAPYGAAREGDEERVLARSADNVATRTQRSDKPADASPSLRGRCARATPRCTKCVLWKGAAHRRVVPGKE